MFSARQFRPRGTTMSDGGKVGLLRPNFFAVWHRLVSFASSSALDDFLTRCCSNNCGTPKNVKYTAARVNRSARLLDQFLGGPKPRNYRLIVQSFKSRIYIQVLLDKTAERIRWRHDSALTKCRNFSMKSMAFQENLIMILATFQW